MYGNDGGMEDDLPTLPPCPRSSRAQPVRTRTDAGAPIPVRPERSEAKSKDGIMSPVPTGPRLDTPKALAYQLEGWS